MLWEKIRASFSLIGRYLQKHEVLAFLIPLIYRLSLELIAGPYTLGYDTNTAYLEKAIFFSRTLDWREMLLDAPLYYMILFALSSVINPVISMKVLGVLLSALLGHSLFSFYREYGLQEHNALEAELVTFFYFPVLRLTWDLHRNMLGIILVLYALVLLKKHKIIASCLTSFLSGLAHYFSFPMISSILLPEITKRERNSIATILASAIPWTLMITLRMNKLSKTLIIARTYSYSPPIGLELILFIIWLFGPLIPFFIMGKLKNRLNEIHKYRGMVAYLIVFLAVAFISRYGYRFVIMASIPAVFIAYILSRGKKRKLKVIIILLAINYTIAPLFDGITVYPPLTESIAQWGPSGMLTGPISFRDMRAAEILFKEIAGYMNDSVALIVYWQVLTSAYNAGINLTSNHVFIKPHYISLDRIIKKAFLNHSIVLLVWFNPNATFIWSDILNIRAGDVYGYVLSGYKVLQKYDRMMIYAYLAKPSSGD